VAVHVEDPRFRLEREVGVLIGRTDGEDDPVVPAQVGLELHPVEIADPHGEKPGANWNGPAMDGVYARSGRACNASPHVGSGDTTPSFAAATNPKRP
jgi:hypothetical protein